MSGLETNGRTKMCQIPLTLLGHGFEPHASKDGVESETPDLLPLASLGPLVAFWCLGFLLGLQEATGFFGVFFAERRCARGRGDESDAEEETKEDPLEGLGLGGNELHLREERERERE